MMDSVEEEIAIRKRLQPEAKESINLPALIATKIEIDEILRIIRPLYIQKKVENLAFELDRRDLPQTLFGGRITEETTPRLRIIRTYSSKQVQDDAYNKLNHQVDFSWHMCFVKVAEAWNQKYTKNIIEALHDPVRIKG
jgi:hypothetical protein